MGKTEETLSLPQWDPNGHVTEIFCGTLTQWYSSLAPPSHRLFAERCGFSWYHIRPELKGDWPSGAGGGGSLSCHSLI